MKQSKILESESEFRENVKNDINSVYDDLLKIINDKSLYKINESSKSTVRVEVIKDDGNI